MLTLKQERFVQELIKGKSQREAYKAAYNAANMKDATIDVHASNLLKQDKIRIRYEELMKESQASAVMDAVQMRAFIIDQLTQIASGKLSDTSEIYDKDGNIVQGRKGIRVTDRVNALKTLSEIYGIAQGDKKEEIRIVIDSPDGFDN